jgi:organic radical activating enzyme|tara:strand:+ start:26543 stop:27151 length:609 start_codon:yes stop_codon:yes gene_type:complete
MKINSENLPVMETFYSIQGEGFHSGKPAYFIRIGGCDIGCGWCDVKESWDHGDHEIINVDKIVSNVECDNGIVIITGGEPLMWDMNVLTSKLKINKNIVHLETSGAYDITGSWDWVCLSPKRKKLPKSNMYKIADELKIIIYNNYDLKFAIEESKKVSKECKLFIQPEWKRFERNKNIIIDFIKENPKWQISLQIHKFMDVD